MRLFTEHKKRKVQSLDGAWQFATDPDNSGLENAWYRNMPKYAESVIIPSVWNTRLGLLEYEGIAWYSRSFYTEGGTLRFVFEAVMTQARVWLDGEELGSHYGGFSSFDFIVQEVKAGGHILTVRVDNSFDAHSIPQAQVDWYHYGGIIRSVSLETLEGICVLGCKVCYQLNDQLDSVSLHYELELFQADDKSKSVQTDYVRAVIRPAGLEDVEVLGLLEPEQVSLAPSERCRLVTKEQILKQVALWSPESPALYMVEVTTSSDDLIDRVGFRKVSVEKEAILLNGKSVELRGINRHEEHPDFGFAFPPALMERDIAIAKEMGCNALRGSHYPNSAVFLDLLDEKGVFFWSEIPIWGVGFSAEALGEPLVLSRGEEMHREMLRDYYNHPSIIFWGMHNEILSDTPEGYEMSRRYYHFLKKNGGNRIVTYASARPMTDICFEFCDVISINAYLGWYERTVDAFVEMLEDFRKRRSELGFADKPVIMSEFGAAAVYGHRSFDDNLWSENYQADLIVKCLKFFHADPMIVGAFIWQFADIRTAREMGLNRARGFNNKGVLNEYRHPKASYYEAGRCYREFAEKPVV